MLGFLNLVRANDSKKIDLLWREFLSFAHTDTANKTQYVPMAILRVFWGLALESELSDLYHKIRIAPSVHVGSNVGWDMLIEWVNHAIKKHVTLHITHDLIAQIYWQLGIYVEGEGYVRKHQKRKPSALMARIPMFQCSRNGSKKLWAQLGLWHRRLALISTL